jgi:hypothetical protein
VPDANPSPDQLDALADQLDLEAEMLSREGTLINERIGLKRRLSSDLRREAEDRRNGGSRLLQLPAPTVTERQLNVGFQANGKPRTSEAVVKVLEARSQPATGRDVYDELERRGWLPAEAKSPRSAIKAALWSLAEKGRIERLGDKPATRRWAAKTASQPPRTQEDGKVAN